MDRNFNTLLSPSAKHDVKPCPNSRTVDFNDELAVADELYNTGAYDGYYASHADVEKARGDEFILELALEDAREIISKRNDLHKKRVNARPKLALVSMTDAAIVITKNIVNITQPDGVQSSVAVEANRSMFSA